MDDGWMEKWMDGWMDNCHYLRHCLHNHYDNNIIIIIIEISLLRYLESVILYAVVLVSSLSQWSLYVLLFEKYESGD